MYLLPGFVDQRARSDRNEIVAPRIKVYTVFGQGSQAPITTAGQARAWVRQNAERGADGINFFGAEPGVFRAALYENKKLGLRSACRQTRHRPLE